MQRSTAKPHLWILEDAEDIADLLQQTYSNNYEMRFFKSLEEFCAARKSCKTIPDLLLADLVLPDGNFFDFIKKQEWQHSPLKPFLVISGETDLDLMRTCINVGAEDFITKPFHVNEITLKVERILQAQREQASQKKVEKPELDAFKRRLVFREKTTSPLTVRESQICQILLASYGSPVHRDEIVHRVWTDKPVSPKSFDVHLSKLRQKIEKIGMRIVLTGLSTYSLTSGIGGNQSESQPA